MFTAKNLTLRENPDEWEAVAAAMHVTRDDLLLVRQVHESTVAIASPDRARPWPRPDADAIVSNDPSAAIAVRVADCVPILLAEETGRVVAAIHAGWRGTSKRAAVAAIAAMQSRFGVRPERLLAAIGPSIGPCCYEVGESTRETFKEDGHHSATLDQWFTAKADGKFLLDLWRANRDQLEGAGVQPECIHVAELCTKTHADVFHSYRVEGTSAGRMIGIITAKA